MDYYKNSLALIIAGLFLIASLAMPIKALADDNAGEIQIHKAGSMDSKENCRSKHPGKLLAVIVPCIRDMVEEATETMTDQFDEYVKPSMWAFCVLVVTIFGVKMLINEGDLKKEGIILLMKIGGVALFMDNFGGLIHDMFAAVQEGSEMVTTALHKTGGQCTGDFQGEEPWNKLDCIVGKMYGFGGNGATIGTAIFGMVAVMPSSGQMGGMLMMAGITALTLVLRLVIRAAYTYLMAMIVMGFLIVISPVLIPLIFMGVTFQYFEHWLRALMSTMLMPLVVLAYVTLAFLVLDKMMFDDKNGIAKIVTKEDFEKAQRGRTNANPNSALGNPKFFGSGKWYADKGRVDSVSPVLSSASDPWSVFNSRYSMNFGDDNVKKSMDIQVALIAFLITAYLLDVMLDNIVGTAQTMLGGGFALGKASSTNPAEDALNKIKENAAKGGGGLGDIKSFMNQIAGAIGGKVR